MDLILWRHAEAEPGEPDLSRRLSAKGTRQAKKMGEWLDRHLPHNCKVLTSPAMRTVQTAEALGRKFKVHPALAPDATPDAMLSAANWPESREPVLLVGHQPTLGRTAALLISGIEQEWTIRKGAFCWIVRKDGGEGEDASPYIKAILGPELVGK